MRRPSPAIAGSVALHAGVVALALVSWPREEMEIKPMITSVPVSIVSAEVIEAAAPDNPSETPVEADAATAPVPSVEEAPPTPEPTPPPAPAPPVLRPATKAPPPAPTPRPTPARPRPAPPRANPTPPRPTPPRPAPKRTAPSLDLDALAGPPRPATKRGPPPTGQQGAGRAPQATGPQLAALAREVVPFWNVPCDVPGGDDLTIRVRVTLDVDGRIVGNPVLDSPRSEPVWRSAADGMIRAMRQAEPFNVPEGFTRQQVPFRFETSDFCRNR